MTDLNYKHAAVGGAGLVAYLLLADEVPAALEDAQATTESIYERVQEVSEDGELTYDPLQDVFYDDPEQGSLNDEPGDDLNISFDAANELLSSVGEYIDPTSYAPDTEVEGTAPSSGVLSDAGDSQVYGDATEAEDDDLNRVGNMDDEQAAMWDRMANYDDAEQADNDYSAPDDATLYDHSDPDQEEAAYGGGYEAEDTIDDPYTDDSDTSTSTSTSTSSSSTDWWSSSSTSDSDDSDTSTLEDEEEDDTNFADNLYDQGGSTGSTFV